MKIRVIIVVILVAYLFYYDRTRSEHEPVIDVIDKEEKEEKENMKRQYDEVKPFNFTEDEEYQYEDKWTGKMITSKLHPINYIKSVDKDSKEDEVLENQQILEKAEESNEEVKLAYDTYKIQENTFRKRKEEMIE
jgi:hypothetical protein